MKRGGDLHPARPDWWPPTKRPRASPGGLIAASVTACHDGRVGRRACARPLIWAEPGGSPDCLAYPVAKACMHVLGTGVPRCLGVAHSTQSPKAARALGCSLTPGLRISFGWVTCMARVASVPGLWTLGFVLLPGACVWVWVVLGLRFWLRPGTPGWGVGVCVRPCARSACTPPLLAGNIPNTGAPADTTCPALARAATPSRQGGTLVCPARYRHTPGIHHMPLPSPTARNMGTLQKLPISPRGQPPGHVGTGEHHHATRRMGLGHGSRKSRRQCSEERFHSSFTGSSPTTPQNPGPQYLTCSSLPSKGRTHSYSTASKYIHRKHNKHSTKSARTIISSSTTNMRNPSD